MSVAEYKTILKTPTGQTVAELPDATGQTHSWYLNASGAASFSLPKYTKTIRPDDISLSYTTLETYRNGTLLWSGQIDTSSGARANSIVTFGAHDWFDYLKFVVINGGTYTAQDPTAIISTLIANMESPFLYDGIGLTMGTMETTQPRDRTYSFIDLRKAIYELTASSTIGGVDVEITPSKVVNVFAQKGKRLDTVSFELGRNVIDYWITGDATNIANVVWLLGAGDGNDMLQSIQMADAATRQAYRNKTQILSRKDIITEATLDDIAIRELHDRQIPRRLVTIHVDVDRDPGWGAYSVGDTVPIRIDDGLNQVDDWFRIYGMELNRTPLGRETAKIITTPN